MKRNWISFGILVFLAFFVLFGNRTVCISLDHLQQELDNAYACTMVQDYDSAVIAYRSAAQNAERQSALYFLLTRRTLVDQLNQTLSTLSSYANPDNQADLSVEQARASAQIRQLKALCRSL